MKPPQRGPRGLRNFSRKTKPLQRGPTLPYFVRMAGSGTAIYSAATMNNMAVLDETP